MKMMTSMEEVRRYAALGTYSVFPVSCEIFSDFTTPIETMRILKNVSTHCYMLESAQANDRWGRYTFLGYDPKLEITCINGELKAGNIWATASRVCAVTPTTANALRMLTLCCSTRSSPLTTSGKS